MESRIGLAKELTVTVHRTSTAGKKNQADVSNEKPKTSNIGAPRTSLAVGIAFPRSGGGMGGTQSRVEEHDSAPSEAAKSIPEVKLSNGFLARLEERSQAGSLTGERSPEMPPENVLPDEEDIQQQRNAQAARTQQVCSVAVTRVRRKIPTQLYSTIRFMVTCSGITCSTDCTVLQRLTSSTISYIYRSAGTGSSSPNMVPTVVLLTTASGHQKSIYSWCVPAPAVQQMRQSIST